MIRPKNGINGNIPEKAVYLFSILYFIALTLLSYIRYLEFYTLNGDLGINMQELWSNTHGYLLFETSDYNYIGAMSHLEIHSSYIAIPVSYLYYLFPGPLTLFMIQAAVVSLSVIALYFLSIEIIGNAKISATLSILYGLNASLLSGVMFDFHWLSFIPLETFLLFLLVLRERYWYSAIMILIGSMTQEIFPFIAASIMLFQFFNTRNGISMKGEWFRRNHGLSYIGLGIFSVSVYVVLMQIQIHVIPVLIGNASVIPALSKNVLQLWDIGRFPIAMSISAAEFWLLSYLLFMFLPIMKPKHILIVGAWMYESIAVVPFYGTLGNQYDFITTSLLAPSAIFGMKEFLSKFPSSKSEKILKYMISAAGIVMVALAADGFGIHVPDFLNIILMIIGTVAAGAAAAFIIRKSSFSKKKPAESVSKLLLLMLISVILMNIMISPINPSNEGQSGMRGYQLSYQIPPQSQYIGLIQSYISSGSTVVASDNLFTLVADNVHAYSLPNIISYPMESHFFPYNSSNLPKFLLLSSSESMFYTTWINSTIGEGTYGLILEIKGDEYPGNIFLYGLGYTGMSEIIYTG